MQANTDKLYTAKIVRFNKTYFENKLVPITNSQSLTVNLVFNSTSPNMMVLHNVIRTVVLLPFLPFLVSAEDECTVAINKYRAMEGKPALEQCGEFQMDMAYFGACTDARNPHASVAKYGDQLCPEGMRLGPQNGGAPMLYNRETCNWDDQVKCWYDEKYENVFNEHIGAAGCCGPCTNCNKGHYKTLMSDAACVACARCDPDLYGDNNPSKVTGWTANFCVTI